MQELSFNMKKRITKSQLGKLVNEQVRKLLGEDKNSEIEQSWNEYDKSNNKNINKAAKFSPVLAKDYNHNVEDGCEGAEDYCRCGLEEKIRKMVEKRLNEDYCWYGNTKPLYTIIECCNQLMKSSKFNDPEYEGDDDDTAAYNVYEWAKKVAQDAETYLWCNSQNVSINGGENW